MPEPLLDYLCELNERTFLLVEYGVESANEETLRRIHRGHTFAQSVDAIRRTAERGIRVGAHIILGFPWDDQADLIATLPLTTLKIHQLQVVRGTQMADEYMKAPWPMPSAEEYIRLVLEYIAHLPSSIILERFVSQSPPELVIAPQWGLKNHEFADLIRKFLR